jgi:hypothetical protein
MVLFLVYAATEQETDQRLTAVEVIADRSTPEHQELVAILHKLASPPSPSTAAGR